MRRASSILRAIASLACVAGAGGTLALVTSSLGAPPAAATTQRGTLFVGNGSITTRRIREYPVPTTGNVAPTTSITTPTLGTIGSVYGMTTDSSGDLWVANFKDDNVVEFTPTSMANGGFAIPKVTLSGTGFDGPVGVLFDSKGDLWVANATGDGLTEFTPNLVAAGGTVTPVVTIAGPTSGLSGPEDITWGPNGDLWVANSTDDTVEAFKPTQLTANGDPKPAVVIDSNGHGSLTYPGGLAFDPSGNLWVVNTTNSTLVRYAASQLTTSGDPTPAITIGSDATDSLDRPWGVTFDGAGDLWVTNQDSGVGKGSVVEFSLAQLSHSGDPVPTSVVNGTKTGLDEPGAVVFVPPPPNYLMIGSDGGTFAFGSAQFEGSLPGIGVHVDDVVGAVPTPDGKGYLMVGSDGGTFAFGDALFEGSLPGIGVNVDDVVGVVPTADDRGYTLVGSDGGIFAFGDATFVGSLPGIGVHVDDIVGVVPTPDDKGYLMVGADGGTFAFGDAFFEGSLPGEGVSVDDIITVVPTSDDRGYLMIGANGAVYPFGDAASEGTLPTLGVTVSDIVDAVATTDGKGYTLFGADGGVFTFGDAENLGSLPGLGVHVSDVVAAVTS